MTETGLSVALLFDDSELVAQLRDALHECGARIVHEGGVASLNRQVLREVDADVLVINLDDGAADALDPLYALIDGDRPRIVFNDAAASATLTGWDRARWARHLAVKVFQRGDIDPPRPTDARGVEVSTVEAGDPVHDEDQPVVADALESAVDAYGTDEDAEAVQRSVIETEALSAELEALLASAELMDNEAGDQAEGAGMVAPDSAELARVGVQSGVGIGDPVATAPATVRDDLLDLLPTADEPPAEGSMEINGVHAQPDVDIDLAVAAPATGLDNLPDASPTGDETSTLGAMADAGIDLAPAAPAIGLNDLLDVLPMGHEPPATSNTLADIPLVSAPPSAPAEWGLVDDDVLTPATFGVEKQTAAEFLAPDTEGMADDDEPVLNLELVSMEEAVAPRPPRAAVEMHLDDLNMALSRLVLTGATLGGAGAALAFFSALPASTQQTFLHTQHLRGQSAVALVSQLANACKLTVTLAGSDASTKPGEILVVPPGHTVRIRRDAHVEVKVCEDALQDPSIDDSFIMAAGIFGRDTVAIVFSGQSTDSIAGAKAIHAGGGQVWLETATPAYADMVHEISAARIVGYSGTPEELAAHLTETFA